MPRRLPSPAETAEILARKRTRPTFRPPPPAGRSLAPALRALEARFGSSDPGPRALRKRWAEIAGALLARHTEPVKLKRGARGGPATLLIRVDGPAAALIQHQGPDIVARVNLMLGPGAVSQIHIVQGPLTRPAALTAPARKKPPLDAAVEADLARGLASAPEGGLKTALLRLGREVARRDGDR